MNNALLLFTDNLPCWDEETISLVDETPDSLGALVDAGCLSRLGNGYVLTEKGIHERERAASENFVPAEKITRLITNTDEARESLEINRMAQLIDRAFMTMWSIKEITVSEKFPVVPCPNDDEFFVIEGGKARALWPSLPIMQDFVSSFPNCTHSARKLPIPGQKALDEWADSRKASRGTFSVDMVIRHRHDFQHYRQMKVPEGDVFSFVNSSLIFAHKVRESAEELLPFIGKVHVFFAGQRRVYLPGWFDMDSEDQETLKILTLVTDTDSQLDELAHTLKSWGNDLIEPARPLFLVGTSIEHLRGISEPKSLFYDWFAEETVKILRPDVED